MCTWGESCHHCSLYLHCGKTRTQSQHTPCPHHSAYSCWDKGVGIETGNLIEPRPSETFTDLRSLGENIPNNDIIILHHTLWQCTLCCPPSFLLHTHLFTHECTGTHLCAFWYTNTHTHLQVSLVWTIWRHVSHSLIKSSYRLRLFIVSEATQYGFMSLLSTERTSASISNTWHLTLPGFSVRWKSCIN